MADQGDDAERIDQSEFPGYVVEEWKPTTLLSVVWTMLATVLTIAALFGFLAIDTALSGSTDFISQAGLEIDRSEPGRTSFSLNLGGFILLMVVGSLILLVHEGFHGLAFRYFGGRPQYGAALLNKILPVLYCTAPGFYFDRKQFAIIILAPAVGISLIGIALMAVTDLGVWLVVPLAINFGGAVGDLWFAGMLLTKPPDTLIEDQRDGLRFFYPTERRRIEAT